MEDTDFDDLPPIDSDSNDEADFSLPVHKPEKRTSFSLEVPSSTQEKSQRELMKETLKNCSRVKQMCQEWMLLHSSQPSSDSENAQDKPAQEKKSDLNRSPSTYRRPKNAQPFQITTTSSQTIGNPERTPANYDVTQSNVVGKPGSNISTVEKEPPQFTDSDEDLFDEPMEITNSDVTQSDVRKPGSNIPTVKKEPSQFTDSDDDLFDKPMEITISNDPSACRPPEPVLSVKQGASASEEFEKFEKEIKVEVNAEKNNEVVGEDMKSNPTIDDAFQDILYSFDAEINEYTPPFPVQCSTSGPNAGHNIRQLGNIDNPIVIDENEDDSDETDDEIDPNVFSQEMAYDSDQSTQEIESVYGRQDTVHLTVQGDAGKASANEEEAGPCLKGSFPSASEVVTDDGLFVVSDDEDSLPQDAQLDRNPRASRNKDLTRKGSPVKSPGTKSCSDDDDIISILPSSKTLEGGKRSDPRNPILGNLDPSIFTQELGYNYDTCSSVRHSSTSHLAAKMKKPHTESKTAPKQKLCQIGRGRSHDQKQRERPSEEVLPKTVGSKSVAAPREQSTAPAKSGLSSISDEPLSSKLPLDVIGSGAAKVMMKQPSSHAQLHSSVDVPSNSRPISSSKTSPEKSKPAISPSKPQLFDSKTLPSIPHKASKTSKPKMSTSKTVPSTSRHQSSTLSARPTDRKKRKTVSLSDNVKVSMEDRGSKSTKPGKANKPQKTKRLKTKEKPIKTTDSQLTRSINRAKTDLMKRLQAQAGKQVTRRQRKSSDLSGVSPSEPTEVAGEASVSKDEHPGLKAHNLAVPGDQDKPCMPVNNTVEDPPPSAESSCNQKRSSEPHESNVPHKRRKGSEHKPSERRPSESTSHDAHMSEEVSGENQGKSTRSSNRENHEDQRRLLPPTNRSHAQSAASTTIIRNPRHATDKENRPIRSSVSFDHREKHPPSGIQRTELPVPVAGSKPPPTQISFITEMLKWKYEDLRNADHSSSIPVQDKGPLLETYNSAQDYEECMLPLLLMEIWEGLVQSRSRVPFQGILCNTLPYHPFHQVKKLRFQVSSRKEEKSISNFDFMTVQQSHGRSESFGFVISVQRERNAGQIHPQLAARDGRHNIIQNVDVLSLSSFEFNKFHDIMVLDNLTSHMRQFDALSGLRKSMLWRNILRPVDDLCFTLKLGDRATCASVQENCNAEQYDAVSRLSEAITEVPGQCKIGLLQGPPGTGKSRTVCQLVKSLVRSAESQGKPIKLLLCAPSNSAIDEICLNLLDLEASQVVRLYASSSEKNPTLKPMSLDQLIENELNKEHTAKLSGSHLTRLEDVNAQILTIDEEIMKIQLQKGKGQCGKIETLIQQKNALRKQQKQLMPKLSDLKEADQSRLGSKVVEKAQVVCTTLSHCASYAMQKLLFSAADARCKTPFTAAIVDEAGQCLELDNLIVLKFGITKLVLVGDHSQLRPTVRSPHAKQLGFDQSLLERLCSHLQVATLKRPESNPMLMLKVQYRMHPDICSFPNKRFYGNKLITHRKLAQKRDNMKVRHYAIFDLEYSQEQSGSRHKDNSLFNPDEEKFVLHLCDALLHKIPKLEENNIGIITPYKKQMSMIVDSLKARKRSAIKVGTVDSFQGRQKDIMILSCVRAQSKSKSPSIGFLADPCRMNVALTRAKYAMYVVANCRTLKVDDHWKALVKDAAARNACLRVATPDKTHSVIGDLF